jgi:hypothetical protein
VIWGSGKFFLSTFIKGGQIVSHPSCCEIELTHLEQFREKIPRTKLRSQGSFIYMSESQKRKRQDEPEDGVDEVISGQNPDEPYYGTSNFDNTRRMHDVSQADKANDQAKKGQPYIKLFDR